MISSKKTEIIYGHGAVPDSEELVRSLGNRYLIITGRNSAKVSGALDDLLNVIRGKEYAIYDGISENPKVSSILEAAELLDDADCVIGIGGGSVLDAAKVIACLKTNPVSNEEELYKQSWENKGAPLILIGTTAGTGSEVTKVAVLSKANGRKSSIHNGNFYPAYALCDPKYTYTMNARSAVSTGIDALTHCNESYFSNKANDESRTYATKGISYLLPGLKKITEGLTDKEKDDMYLGSLYAGLAIDITGTVFAHNVGYYLTENFHLPHGFACAFFQEDLFDFEEKHNKDYTDEFFDKIGMTKEGYCSLINSLLPDEDISISEETLSEILPRWDGNNSVRNTYGSMTVEDVGKILRKHFVK
ncbi:MAG: iron-containing alcohol dehydrogenase [Erysipelotrichaceae bacterium]|nr:iron-containing alcohol dehydrogenase [Erysipelotrichaceae bacterium]